MYDIDSVFVDEDRQSYRIEKNEGWVRHTGLLYRIHQPLSDRTDTKERFHRTVQVRDIIDRVWYIQKLSLSP